jgi:uncharacterized membrane protein YraQ (UPF0718 family)/copper chaperone CopZ
MAEYFALYYIELRRLIFDMAPWLLLGFLIAGILHVFFPEGKVGKILGKSNTKSVINAALIGVPLPLCSCGVIPAGVSLYKNGASKGSAISFLISTPQTGVDSILVTYSMLGLPLAIIRPVIAFVTGIAGGIITNLVEKPKQGNISHVATSANNGKTPNRLFSVLSYAFYYFMKDIAKWLIIGLLIAALIAVLIPDDFLAGYLKNNLLGMVIMLFVSIPVYVCATSSVPIAAVLVAKGLSPGAALVFLMAGPASNAATITVIGKTLGRRTLMVYLTVLAAGALFFGIIVDYLLPQSWFSGLLMSGHSGHSHGLLPDWIKTCSGILFVLFLANVYMQKWIKKIKFTKDKITIIDNMPDMNKMKIIVKGMTCSHCKMSIERNLSKIEGIEEVLADVDRDEVAIKGKNIDLEKVKSVIEDIGYQYAGLVSL